MQGKKVLQDRMPGKTPGGDSSFERVIKSKDGGTQIHFIRGAGVGEACMHQSASHEKKQNSS